MINQGNIRVRPLNRGQVEQNTNFTDGRTIRDFEWSRDGKQLAVLSTTNVSDIVLLKGLQGRKPK